MTLIECEKILDTDIPAISVDKIRGKWLHLQTT